MNSFNFNQVSARIKRIKINKKILHIVLWSVCSTIVILILLGVAVWFNRTRIFDYLAGIYTQREAAQMAEGSSQPFLTDESFVENAVKTANPAVVSIIITKTVPKYETVYTPNDSTDTQNPLDFLFGPNSDFFDQFFQQEVPEQRQDGTEQEQVGGGSGFLISSDGLIVTNRHVVEDPTAVYTVFLNNGQQYTAKVLARDQILDIAVLKIAGSNFPYLSLGDSDTLQLGQSVVAIGNALGQFKNSVSVGVISGLSRSITAGDEEGESEQLDQVIQTDAAINPGNSGGPLLNLEGQVIGVNVAIVEGSENIGFALPINSIKTVIQSVEATGMIIRPYIGIRYVPITSELQTEDSLSVGYGILIEHGTGTDEPAVIPGSPADKAGLKEGDIVLDLDGMKLDQTTDFAQLIREKKVGDSVTLTVLSGGVQKTITLILVAAPQS